MGFPSGTVVKNLSANSGNTGDVGSIPASGRSPGVGNRKPLQYSCLENSVDREALWATVHKNTQSWTWQNMHANRWLSYPRLGQGLSKNFSTFWRKYQVEFFFFHSLLWNYISWASQRPSKDHFQDSCLSLLNFKWWETGQESPSISWIWSLRDLGRCP